MFMYDTVKKFIILSRPNQLNLFGLQNIFLIKRRYPMILSIIKCFYHKIETTDDIIDSVTGKIFALLHEDHFVYFRWRS